MHVYALNDYIIVSLNMKCDTILVLTYYETKSVKTIVPVAQLQNCLVSKRILGTEATALTDIFTCQPTLFKDFIFNDSLMMCH